METKNADELKNEYDSRFALRRARREEQKVKLMVGKTAFKLPDTNAYKKTAQHHWNNDKRNFVEKLANNEGHMEGLVFVNDYHAQKEHKRRG